jgi:HSP20 family molecular chaperone IbpA
MRYRRLGYRYTMVMTTGDLPPFAELLRLGGQGMVLAQPQWRPEADVYETPAAVVVVVELAGVDEEAFEVLLFEDALVLDGHRRIPTCEEGGLYHAVGIRQGPFRLEVRLPGPVDADRVHARYERGLLWIRLPKTRESERHGR